MIPSIPPNGWFATTTTAPSLGTRASSSSATPARTPDACNARSQNGMSFGIFHARA